MSKLEFSTLVRLRRLLSQVQQELRVLVREETPGAGPWFGHIYYVKKKVDQRLDECLVSEGRE